MYTIGIVDDRPEVRTLAESRVNRALSQLELRESWEVVAVPPLPSLADYSGWLTENDIVVLLLDQRLDESHELEVAYSGSDILNMVHPRMFDLPVYYFTAAKDAAVESGASKVRAILDQQELFDDTLPWAREFVREGMRFEQKLSRRLMRLGELSEIAASGAAEPGDLEEAAALRAELHLPFEGGSRAEERDDASRADLLGALEGELAALERLATRLEADLGRGDRSKPSGA